MNIAKSEKIHNMCKPNALTTLMEYACDYGDESFLKKTEDFVRRQAATIERDDQDWRDEEAEEWRNR